MQTPIVVMSFNRPPMLEAVLDSLLAQTGVGDMHSMPVHLFQDGAVNRYSRLRYASDTDVAGCIEVFKRKFPNGVVHASEDNIGVCENFHRAELFVFNELGAECAYFFEDDLALSPAYISMMNILRDWALSESNVAYFAAYGDYYAPPEDRLLHARELNTLDHHWGFGLLARHWRAMQPYLKDFYSLVQKNDYQRRPHRAVFDLYRKLDISPRASSQDAAKATACARLGLLRCNTVESFAKYIGATGLHMTSDMYEKMGFANTNVRQQPITNLRLPDALKRLKLIDTNINMLKEIRSNEFDGIYSKLPCLEISPARLCKREDVIFGYKFLLCREPESEQIISSHEGKRSVGEFICGLIKSAEYLSLADKESGIIGDGNSITAAYHLLLHREPDESSLNARIAGQYDIRSICLNIIDSDEFKLFKSRFSI